MSQYSVHTNVLVPSLSTFKEAKKQLLKNVQVVLMHAAAETHPICGVCIDLRQKKEKRFDNEEDEKKKIQD